MKDLKSRISDFLASEDGRVGVKAPLALGVAAGGLMLAQAFVVTPTADACTNQDDCAGDQHCTNKCVEMDDPDGDGIPTCIKWVGKCEGG